MNRILLELTLFNLILKKIIFTTNTPVSVAAVKYDNDYNLAYRLHTSVMPAKNIKIALQVAIS